MRRPSRTCRAAALLVSAGLAFGPAAPATAQPRAVPANVFASLAIDPLEPATPRVTTPSAEVSNRLRSGFVPAECRAEQAQNSPRLVDCWLEHMPLIAAAIRWEFVGPSGPRIRSWPEWDDPSRESLRQAFQSARRWYAGGMKSWPGPQPPEPPENREGPHLNDNSIATVFDGATAWSLFSAQVGLSLAAEIDRWVPWSLREYDAATLADLFDAPGRMFTYGRDEDGGTDPVVTGYSPRGLITPAHPSTTFRFLRENRMIGASPVDTITAVLDWSRREMRLAPQATSERPRTRHIAYWQYEGKAPLARILAGTRFTPGARGTPQLMAEHWTGGCAMTTDAFIWILRAANIPVRRAPQGPAVRTTCGHVTPFFSAEGLYLSHGDDPYDPMTTTASFPTKALLVRAAVWKFWFPEGDGEPWCWNVGRSVLDLNIRHPSETLVTLYCTDVLTGTPRDQSRVLSAFRNVYTLKRLTEDGLWSRLLAEAATSNAAACTRLRTGMSPSR